MNVMHIVRAMKDLRFYPTCPANSFMDLAENMKKHESQWKDCIIHSIADSMSLKSYRLLIPLKSYDGDEEVGPDRCYTWSKLCVTV